MQNRPVRRFRRLFAPVPHKRLLTTRHLPSPPSPPPPARFALRAPQRNALPLWTNAQLLQTVTFAHTIQARIPATDPLRQALLSAAQDIGDGEGDS